MSSETDLINQCQEEFSRIDTDKNGFISNEEFVNYYKNHDLFVDSGEAMINWMFDVIDADHNGKISIEEFSIFVDEIRKIDSADERWFERLIFRMMDTDNNGTLDADELKRLIKVLGLPSGKRDIEDFIDALDTNGDGLINMDEFLHLFSDD